MWCIIALHARLKKCLQHRTLACSEVNRSTFPTEYSFSFVWKQHNAVLALHHHCDLVVIV
jgi:hypothetical protein